MRKKIKPILIGIAIGIVVLGFGILAVGCGNTETPSNPIISESVRNDSTLTETISCGSKKYPCSDEDQLANIVLATNIIRNPKKYENKFLTIKGIVSHKQQTYVVLDHINPQGQGIICIFERNQSKKFGEGDIIIVEGIFKIVPTPQPAPNLMIDNVTFIRKSN